MEPELKKVRIHAEAEKQDKPDDIVKTTATTTQEITPSHANIIPLDPEASSEFLDKLRNAYKLTTLMSQTTTPNVEVEQELQTSASASTTTTTGIVIDRNNSIINNNNNIQEEYETLKLSFEHMRRENKKKDKIISDLILRLEESQEHSRIQSIRISELEKNQLSSTHAIPIPIPSIATSASSSPVDRHHHHTAAGTSPSSTSSPITIPSTTTSDVMMTTTTTIEHPLSSSSSLSSSPSSSSSSTTSTSSSSSMAPVYLQIVQNPPSQAVYQRILRPFPTVAVVGVSHLKSCNNLFVEVSLMKQDEYNSRGISYQHVDSCKSGTPLSGERRNLIGGQLVQRSELGATPDTLMVVFRKLKVLTTTAQQGGAFFVLKFVLKRYVDNNFEEVPHVNSVISDPIEVFSHTLYLKGRPSPGTPLAANGSTVRNNGVAHRNTTTHHSPPSSSSVPGTSKQSNKSPNNNHHHTTIAHNTTTTTSSSATTSSVMMTPSTVISTSSTKKLSPSSSLTSPTTSHHHHHNHNNMTTLAGVVVDSKGVVVSEEDALLDAAAAAAQEDHIMYSSDDEEAATLAGLTNYDLSASNHSDDSISKEAQFLHLLSLRKRQYTET